MSRTDAPGSANDEDLEAAKLGDEAAFRRIYRATQPHLARYVSTLVGADAEDVCSEAWLQACRDLGKFKGDLEGFRGWIARIARNRAIDLLRAQQRRPAEPTSDEALLDRSTTTTVEDDVLAAVSTEVAVRLIAALPPDQAEAVMLRAVMGLDAKTAAKVLNKRPGAVRTAAYRGLRTLASQLSRHVTT